MDCNVRTNEDGALRAVLGACGVWRRHASDVAPSAPTFNGSRNVMNQTEDAMLTTSKRARREFDNRQSFQDEIDQSVRCECRPVPILIAVDSPSPPLIS